MIRECAGVTGVCCEPQLGGWGLSDQDSEDRALLLTSRSYQPSWQSRKIKETPSG